MDMTGRGENIEENDRISASPVSEFSAFSRKSGFREWAQRSMLRLNRESSSRNRQAISSSAIWKRLKALIERGIFGIRMER